jgi:quercetin dioxygenase-like cupin family protein
MQVHRWESLEREEMTPQIARRVVHSARMTTARIYIKKGGVVPRHSHDNEQISHVLEGRLLFELDGASFEVAAGEIMEIAPNEPHRVTALEDSLAMDVFAPVRADWVSGDDAYLRNPAGGQ